MTAKLKTPTNVGLIVALVIVALSITGCGAGTVARKPAKKKPDTQAHTIPKKDYNDVMRDAVLNIKLLNNVRDETQALERFLAEATLKEMTEQINADLAAGKVKVRGLKSVKFKLSNYTKGIVGLSMSYVDDSYYVDKATGKQLSKPSHTKEKRALALRKIAGRWKIFGIFGGLKPGVPRK